jgi:hypothetical protein
MCKNNTGSLTPSGIIETYLVRVSGGLWSATKQ